MNTNPVCIFKCASCDTLVKRPDTRDFLKEEMKRYSDFSVNMAKYHIWPRLAKCRDCDSIFWLRKVNSVELSTIANKDIVVDIKDTAYLDLEDYYSALSNGMVESMEDELMVRRQIWWLYNDRVKLGHALCNDKDDLMRWSINLERILALASTHNDPLDVYHKVMIAEINRNLGAFDNCIGIIQSIEGDEIIDIREQLIAECERRNRWVVEI